MPTDSHPIEGQIVLLAGAKASVPLYRLSTVLVRAQRAIREERADFDREFERIDGPRDVAFYLVEDGFWESFGENRDFDDREVDAVRRAHTEQFRRAGRRLERTAEFESALEVRDVVAVDQSSR